MDDVLPTAPQCLDNEMGGEHLTQVAHVDRARRRDPGRADDRAAVTPRARTRSSTCSANVSSQRSVVGVGRSITPNLPATGEPAAAAAAGSGWRGRRPGGRVCPRRSTA